MGIVALLRISKRKRVLGNVTVLSGQWMADMRWVLSVESMMRTILLNNHWSRYTIPLPNRSHKTSVQETISPLPTLHLSYLLIELLRRS